MRHPAGTLPEKFNDRAELNGFYEPVDPQRPDGAGVSVRLERVWAAIRAGGTTARRVGWCCGAAGSACNCLWRAWSAQNNLPRVHGNAAVLHASTQEAATRLDALDVRASHACAYLPQHFLYFFPLPHGQGSFRPTATALSILNRSPGPPCTFGSS